MYVYSIHICICTVWLIVCTSFLDGGANATRESNDAVNQSTLSDALRKERYGAVCFNAVQHSSDENTDELIALADEKFLKTPTASPSSKKSRRSGNFLCNSQ